eukprot:2062795-Pleurochrysis_carterae.AAC.2
MRRTTGKSKRDHVQITCRSFADSRQIGHICCAVVRGSHDDHVQYSGQQSAFALPSGACADVELRRLAPE